MFSQMPNKRVHTCLLDYNVELLALTITKSSAALVYQIVAKRSGNLKRKLCSVLPKTNGKFLSKKNALLIRPLFRVQARSFPFMLHVNLCKKLLFLHQLTHNMTTDCSWNYSSLHENCKRRTCCVHKLFFVLTVTACSAHVLPMFCTCNFHVLNL